MSSRLFYSQLFGVLLIILLLLFAVPKYLKTIPETLTKKIDKRLSTEQLKWVSVRANGRDITLSGVAPSIEEHHKAIKLSKDVFGVRNVLDQISPEVITPYTMNIVINTKEIKVKGYLPTKEDKQRVVAIIKKEYPKHTLKDAIDIGTGNPPSWNGLIDTLLVGLKDLDASSVHLVDDNVQISGKIKTLKEKDLFEKTLEKFNGKPYKLHTHIVAMDKPKVVCQEKFNTLLSHQKIKFPSGESHVAKESTKLIQELAYISSLCPQASLDIVGHTDSLGNNEKNRKLSLDRAKAVVAKLFQEGVALERMNAFGAGESKPIANNKSEAGRAKNRRIEFKVIMNKEP